MKKLLIFLILACGCSKKDDMMTLKVAATPVPQAQLLHFVKPELEKEGIKLKVIEMDDYNIPNRALAEKEVDANFFQHIPFMDEQIKNFGYKIQCYARIELEPMAIYSDKISSLKDLKKGATIAVPNDPTNEFRALMILQKEGLITLRPGAKLTATAKDIQGNPLNLKFREIDAALLTRTLPEVDAAAIPTNFALQIGLNPSKNSLARESADSPYANIIAIRIGDADDPRLEALKKAMLSDKMRTFIEDTYKGAIIPVLKDCP